MPNSKTDPTIYEAIADALALAFMSEPIKELPRGALDVIAASIEPNGPHGAAIAEFLRRAGRWQESAVDRVARVVPGVLPEHTTRAHPHVLDD